MAKILLIDDEPDIRRFIVSALQDASYETIEASSGRQGLAKMRGHNPDLVLCDITMEDLDGYQVLAEMRQDHRYAHTPFIFLSALADHKDVIVGKVRGGDGYLTKPVDFEILLVTVASHLRQMARVTAGEPNPSRNTDSE